MSGVAVSELEDTAQEKPDTRVLEPLNQHQQSRLREIDEALSRRDSGVADNDASVAAESSSDLDGLDDSQCSEYLLTIFRHHGQVDSEELIRNARAGATGLEGAVFIEGQHQVLLSLLTDTTRVFEIGDHLKRFA